MSSVPSNERPGRAARLRRLLVDLGPTTPLLALATLGPLAGVAVLTATSPIWLPWFGSDAGSVFAFWLTGAGAAAVCLVPTHATSLAAGFLFGAGVGVAVAWLVVVLAAVLGFAICHRLVGSRATGALAGSPRAIAVHRALLGRGFWRTTWLIALLRLSPVLPFAATNLLMAAFGVRPLAFLLATALGIAPRAAAVAIVGAELSELDWQAGRNVWSTVFAIAATIAVVAVVGRIAGRALRRESQLAAGEP
jgi:uncharacterized membrane protein YdjX (TVP38/TMEM64 family)